MRNALFLMAISISAFGYANAQTKWKSTMQLDSPEKVKEAAQIWSDKTGKVLVVLPGWENVAPAPLPDPAKYIDLKTFNTLVDRWPYIKLNVISAPPRDYSITINGQSYDATERSEYAVPPGTLVAMTVVRGSFPPCTWNGKVERNQEVICRLPSR